MSFNKIIIVGNVGREPELKMTPNGRPVCEFSVAVNRVTGKGDDRQEQTDGGAYHASNRSVTSWKSTTLCPAAGSTYTKSRPEGVLVIRFVQSMPKVE